MKYDTKIVMLSGLLCYLAGFLIPSEDLKTTGIFVLMLMLLIEFWPVEPNQTKQGCEDI